MSSDSESAAWAMSISLSDAVLHYANQGDRVAYLDAARQVTAVESIAGPPTSDGFAELAQRLGLWSKTRARYWRSMCDRLLAHLRHGAVIARGFTVPVSAESVPVVIAPHLWDALKPDFGASAARADDLVFRHIRVIDRQLWDAAISAPNRRTATITAENRCREWLREHATRSEEKPWPNKSKAFDEAKLECGEGLSQRAFDRAWAVEAPKSWKHPGRYSPR